MSSDFTPFFDFLTQDLINEILVRLPVKSLLRCKSVSKPWLSLISNPNFIKSHLKHSLTKPGADQTLIVKEGDNYSLSLLHLDSTHIQVPLGLPFSRGDYSFEPYYKVVGSCNGLLCVSVSNFRIDPEDYGMYTYNLRTNPNTYLWNPATKQSKLIPPHNLRDEIMSVAFGFGFDPIGNDYKVVRIVHFSTNKPRASEVYSANTNVWQKVRPFYSENVGIPEFGDYDFQVPEDFPEFNEFDVCVNGILCCLGFYGILAFDLNNEVFTTHNPVPVRSSDYCFTDFNDSIAVITYKKKEWNYYIYNLWTLDDEACFRGGRVKATWTLKLSIDVQYPDLRVWGCFNSVYFVFTKDDDCLLYNSHKKEAKNVSISIIIGRRVIKYNESLVSITGSKQVDWNAHEDDDDIVACQSFSGGGVGSV